MQRVTGPDNFERRIIAIDIETESLTELPDDALNPFKNKITLIAISDGDKINRIFRNVKDAENYIVLLLQTIKPVPDFTFHNGKFDLKNLIQHGFNKHLALNIFNHDSSLLAFTSQDKVDETWLSNYDERRTHLNKITKSKHRKAGPHSLKTLAPYFLGVEPFWETNDHNNEEYALKDAAYTARLTRYFLEKLDARSLDFYNNKYLPWTKNLLKAELSGINIDTDELKKRWLATDSRASQIHGELIKEWKEHLNAYMKMQQEGIKAEYEEKFKGKSEKQIANLEKTMFKRLQNVESLNFDSPTQLRWLLQERLKLNISTLEGDESTGKEVLVRLSSENEQVKKLLEYRKLRKLSTSFFPEYWRIQQQGKIYTNFNVTSTRTGRLSSSDPNLQQVPGHLHDLFTASPGNVLITRDLSAIEPTILAYYSEDEELCNLMINNIRFHSVNAITMFNLDCELKDVKKLFPNEDKVAKTVGLAILYGAGANRVYQTLQQAGMSDYTLDDAKQFVYRIRDKYSGVWEFKKKLDAELESGATLYNLLGRPFKIKDPQDVYMQGLNTLIQSSASDLLQDRAFAVTKALPEINPLLFVHDELVLEAPNATFEETIINIMSDFKLETPYGNIPIRTEGKAGRTWEK